ncbi:MAG: primosomal protein N' [Ignavibacteriae bacterium]|nr:primosomal protein N' [Ignavibacteriota bacterium]
MASFADIAIPNVPKHALTYGVPEGLASSVEAGRRVVVPLGRRPVMGFVLAVHDTAPAFRVKAIEEVLDPSPVFSPLLMRLCDWVARYYCCGLGDALKAALPKGMDIGSERYVSLASDDERVLARAIGTSKTKRMIVEALLTGELLSEAVLRDIAGLTSISAQLHALEKDGAVTVESVIGVPQARKKMINVVRLLPPWNRQEKISELMELLEKRAPKQVDVLAVLWSALSRSRPTVPMPEVLATARASAAAVRALEEKEIVEVLQEEVTREPRLLYEEVPKSFTLTEDQTQVLAAVSSCIDAGGYHGLLLHGVTASGKTQVYIEAIRHTLTKDRRALVLVPEIALTPQLVFRFRHAFGKDVAVLHSRMSVGERYDAWRNTLAGRYRIVVGVRSAVFAPLENVGLIVVDEEHESSYKQTDQQPRYHARDAALMRGRFENATVLLGTATPSAESWHNAANGKLDLLRMPRRIDAAVLPTVSIVDMTEQRRQSRARGPFSDELLRGIGERIARNESSIVLHNRRGYAPFLECRDCGHVEECTNCSVTMVVHKDRNQLRCHYCGASRTPPGVCPRCGGTALDPVGAGTQRVEEELASVLPAARLLRMDFDTTRKKGSHDLILSSFGEGEADVLLGTQMVAKGLDFERVTLVGVVSAEQSLMLPDFRAGERAFQLLTQVAGRSGRGTAPGEVLIQSVRPDHPVLQRVVAHDFEGFIAAELESRKAFTYPPYSRLVLLLFSGSREDAVSGAARAWHAALQRRATCFTMYPPQPAVIQRLNNRYRHQILVRVSKSKDPDGSIFARILRDAEEDVMRVKTARSVRVDVDVDPQQML